MNKKYSKVDHAILIQYRLLISSQTIYSAQDILAKSILHDTIEDTDLTRANIEAAFVSKIISQVLPTILRFNIRL